MKIFTGGEKHQCIIVKWVKNQDIMENVNKGLYNQEKKYYDRKS